MNTHLSFSLALASLLAVAGCSTTAAPADSGSGTDAPAATDAPVAVDVPTATDAPSATDAPAGEDAPFAGDAGAASVAWTTTPEPLTIDTDIGLDFFYQYEVYLVGDPFSYELDLERCIHIAGMTESCETVPRDPLAFSSGIRWGIDPSMYAVGENRYRFTLTLRQGTTVVDTDTIELVANVTACTSCVGS